MNRIKISALVLSALMLVTSLCACDSENKSENSKTESSNNISSAADSKETSKADTDKQDNSKIFADYLNGQKLCKITKNFKILEAGTARDNPNGLAGAVKYDFDGDKDEELVTFTFDRNNKNGDDIRIDLMKVKDGKVETADSKYLTEMVDLDDIIESVYSERKEDTIYFSNRAVLQIATSEYNGKMYFGFIVGEAPFEIDGIYTAFSVCSIENMQITPQMKCVNDNGYCGRLIYAEILPPSLRNKEISGEFINKGNGESDIKRGEEIIENEKKRTINVGKTILNSENFSPGGDYRIEYNGYPSQEKAFSAMLNEFGLDIKAPVSSNENRNEMYDWRFISVDNAAVNSIIQTTQLLTYKNNDKYVSCKLELSSDLEKLIGNDTPFTEPLADENALYEDILRYPQYYREVWDKINNEISGSDNLTSYYFVSDINGDNKNELILLAGFKNSALTGIDIFVKEVVTPDLKIHTIEDEGAVEIYDNGTLKSYMFMSSARVEYIVLNGDENYKGELNHLNEDGSRTVTIDINGTYYEGDEAKVKIAELENGTLLKPEWTAYNLYDPESFKELLVQKVEDIRLTGNKLYIDKIKGLSSPNGKQYALADINGDGTYELITMEMETSIGGGQIFSMRNNDVYEMFNMEPRNEVSCYSGDGIVCVGYSLSSGPGYKVYQITDGAFECQADLFHDMMGNTYTIDSETVSEDVYNQKLNEYLDKCPNKIDKYYSYDEIIEMLSK